MTERPLIRLSTLHPDDSIPGIDEAPPIRDDGNATVSESFRAARRGLVQALGHSGLGPRARGRVPINAVSPPQTDARAIFEKLNTIENRGDLDSAQLRLRTDLACLPAIPQTPDMEHVKFDVDVPPTEHENLLTLRNILALHLYGMQMEDPVEARRQNIDITTEEQTLRAFEAYLRAIKASELIDERTLVREVRSLFDILEDREDIRRIKISDASIRRAYLMSPEIAITGLKEATFYGRKLLSTYHKRTAGSEDILSTYTELAKTFLQSEHIDDIAILFEILLKLKDRFGRRLAIIGKTIEAMLSLLPEGKTKRILLAIVNEPKPLNTRTEMVEQTLNATQDKLLEGENVQKLLEILEGSPSTHCRVAYWIAKDLFESAKEEFLATQTADSLRRKARKSLGKNSTEETVLQYVFEKGEREIAETVSQKMRDSAISGQNLSNTVKEIIFAENVSNTAAIAVSSEIESCDETLDADTRGSLLHLARSRTSEKLRSIRDASVSRALETVFTEFEIRQLTYELRECPLAEETRAQKTEKLTRLLQKRGTHTDEEIHFGMRIVKHTIIMTYKQSCKIKGETDAQKEIGTDKEIAEAIKLLEDKERSGEKFARNFMSRDMEDALYILRQTCPHMRRCTPLPFDLYELRAETEAEAEAEAYDDTTYKDLLRARYEFIFDVADIDLFDPPLQQHIPCLVRVVIEHLSRYGKNIFDN